MKHSVYRDGNTLTHSHLIKPHSVSTNVADSSKEGFACRRNSNKHRSICNTSSRPIGVPVDAAKPAEDELIDLPDPLVFSACATAINECSNCGLMVVGASSESGSSVEALVDHTSSCSTKSQYLAGITHSALLFHVVMNLMS